MDMDVKTSHIEESDKGWCGKKHPWVPRGSWRDIFIGDHDYLALITVSTELNVRIHDIA